jgi:hypothetical protein
VVQLALTRIQLCRRGASEQSRRTNLRERSTHLELTIEQEKYVAQYLQLTWDSGPFYF